MKGVYGEQSSTGQLLLDLRSRRVKVKGAYFNNNIVLKIRSGVERKKIFGVCVNNGIPTLYHKNLLVHVLLHNYP